MGHWQQCRIQDLVIVHYNPECNRSRVCVGDLVMFNGIIRREGSRYFYDEGFNPDGILGVVADIHSAESTAAVRFTADVGGWGGDQTIGEYLEDTERGHWEGSITWEDISIA